MDFAFVPYAKGATATVNMQTDVLTVTAGGSARTVQLTGDYTGVTFSTMTDNANATNGVGAPGTTVIASGGTAPATPATPITPTTPTMPTPPSTSAPPVM